MRSRNFMINHLREVLRAAQAELDGDEALAKRLHAQARLRLVTMSDNELCELARITCPPEMPVEEAYDGIRKAREEHRATAEVWLDDLSKDIEINKDVTAIAGSILIIEPDTKLRETISSALAEAGFVVAHVADFARAFLNADRFNPDLVILDEVLPDENVYRACCLLRSVFGAAVILLGQKASDDSWQEAVTAGADFYMKKPPNRLKLVARVRAILRRYQQAKKGLIP